MPDLPEMGARMRGIAAERRATGCPPHGADDRAGRRRGRATRRYAARAGGRASPSDGGGACRAGHRDRGARRPCQPLQAIAGASKFPRTPPAPAVASRPSPATTPSWAPGARRARHRSRTDGGPWLALALVCVGRPAGLDAAIGLHGRSGAIFGGRWRRTHRSSDPAPAGRGRNRLAHQRPRRAGRGPRSSRASAGVRATSARARRSSAGSPTPGASSPAGAKTTRGRAGRLGRADARPGCGGNPRPWGEWPAPCSRPAPGSGARRKGSLHDRGRRGPQVSLRHRPGLAVHRPRPHRGAPGRSRRHRHGRHGRPGSDDVFAERLYRSVKHEEVRPRAPTPASPRRGPRSGATSASTTLRGRIRPSAGRRTTRPASTGRSRSRRRHSQGGDPSSSSPDVVRTNRATSPGRLRPPPLAAFGSIEALGNPVRLHSARECRSSVQLE